MDVTRTASIKWLAPLLNAIAHTSSRSGLDLRMTVVCDVPLCSGGHSWVGGTRGRTSGYGDRVIESSGKRGARMGERGQWGMWRSTTTMESNPSSQSSNPQATLATPPDPRPPLKRPFSPTSLIHDVIQLSLESSCDPLFLPTFSQSVINKKHGHCCAICLQYPSRPFDRFRFSR
jgi:hypothetical protein